MNALLRRPSRAVSCFFCQTVISPPPPSPRSFLCPHCTCWNRFDEQGNIMSDDPAMHDEGMNLKSFARRGSPRKDRFPTTFEGVRLCSTCQSNQRLVISLLSSYLPPSEDDPGYARRLAEYDAYKASVDARYPQVCADCAPLVEAEIRKKDRMARANALGGWLKDSKGKDSRRRVSASKFDRHKLDRELRWWRVRGALWAGSLCCVLAGEVAGALGRLPPRRLVAVAPGLPVFMILSVLWTAWHPTHASLRRAEVQGRKVRVRGEKKYVRLQFVVWMCRFVAASLIALSWYNPSMDYLSFQDEPSSRNSRVYFALSSLVELYVITRSFFVLRLHQPPSVRLLDNYSRSTTPLLSSRSATPSLTFPSNFPPAPPASHTIPPEMLDSLSLSAAPVLPRVRQTSPVFGHPSLVPTPLPTSEDVRMDEDDPDAMDWTPTSPAPTPAAPITNNWGREPRAFKPSDQTTGLESLLARTNIEDSSHSQRPGRLGGNNSWSGIWLYAFSVASLTCAAYMAWRSTRWRVYVDFVNMDL
ncbi:hypothetical protein BV25DRAFT_557601 [Artomyces pyxidatus]|uniref:Uncharacterized protein n=1 Tax=Artomyces pyxidatus TaxID=48021 RepID=A0ACB8TIS5_9AGAM|nr:hypothetical protein BV25DRAFT_557601 [Artomyces pyxidatus]